MKTINKVINFIIFDLIGIKKTNSITWTTGIWKCDHPDLKILESIEKEHIYIRGAATCSHPYHKICMVCGTKI